MWRFETISHKTIPEGRQSSIFRRALHRSDDYLYTTFSPHSLRTFQILYRLSFRSASKSSIEQPSTPAAPLLAFTFRYAFHTSRFEMTNGLSDDFSSLTQFLPDQRPVDQTNKPQATRPLRSTPITRASPLLRAGPPANPRDGTQSLTGSARSGHSLSLPALPRHGSSVGVRLPKFHTRAADQTHVTSTPDTIW